MNEGIMQYGLYRHHNRKPLFTNVHYGCNEWDAVHVTTSGYITGYEIKLSKSDFKADFKKERFNLLKNRTQKVPHPVWVDYNIEIGLPVKHFYYVINGFHLDDSEVPDFAGLIIMDNHAFPKFVKQAPILWKEKITEKQLHDLYEAMGKRYIYKTAEKNRKLYEKMVNDKLERR